MGSKKTKTEQLEDLAASVAEAQPEPEPQWRVTVANALQFVHTGTRAEASEAGRKLFVQTGWPREKLRIQIEPVAAPEQDVDS